MSSLAEPNSTLLTNPVEEVLDALRSFESVNLDGVLPLLRYCTKPEDRDALMRTAASYCQVGALKAFLGAGFPAMDDDGLTLILACQASCLEAVTLLVREDASPRAFDDEALVAAAAAGATAIVDFLLGCGCLAGAQNNTPLLFALGGGHAECAKRLLDGGASLDSVQEEGVRQACMTRGPRGLSCLKLVAPLIGLSVLETVGLQSAAWAADAEMVRYLLSLNCDPTTNDCTAFSCAFSVHAQRVVDLMLDHALRGDFLLQAHLTNLSARGFELDSALMEMEAKRRGYAFRDTD